MHSCSGCSSSSRALLLALGVALVVAQASAQGPLASLIDKIQKASSSVRLARKGQRCGQGRRCRGADCALISTSIVSQRSGGRSSRFCDCFPPARSRTRSRS